MWSSSHLVKMQPRSRCTKVWAGLIACWPCGFCLPSSLASSSATTLRVSDLLCSEENSFKSRYLLVSTVFEISCYLLLTRLAVGLLVMMYPILCKVKYESLHHVFAKKQIWIQIGFSVFVNWIIAPFLMVGLLYIHLLISLDTLADQSLAARSCLGIPP